MKARRDFIVFLIVHFIVWACVPLMKGNLHPDSLEAIDWGMIGGWLNDKHPPLSGWLAYGFFRLFGGLDLGIYVLAQLCMLATFVYVYRLARLLLGSEAKAIASAMLLEGCVYYTIAASDQLNCNTISVPLWAATAYYFYKGTHGGRLRDWALFGLAAGLAALDKYSIAFLLAPMAAYAFASKTAREQFATPGPYIGATIAAALFAPHFYWLWKTDFATLAYAENAIARGSAWPWMRAVEPLRYAAGTFISALGSMAIYAFARRGARQGSAPRGKDSMFVAYIAFGPLATFMLASIALNAKMNTMWQIPLLYPAGLVLFFYFPFEIAPAAFGRIRRGAYVFMALFAAFGIARYSLSDGRRIHFPRDEFLAEMYSAWEREANGAPWKYVAGNAWYSSIVSIYGHGSPRTILLVDRVYRRELTPASLAQDGIVIFGNSKEKVTAWLDGLGVSRPVEKSSARVESPLGRMAEYDFYYAIVPPEGGRDARAI